jgi:hypothetical protein
MSMAADRVTGMLSAANEWRKSRLLLVVLTLCGLGERRRAAERSLRAASNAAAWENRGTVKVGA